MSTADKRGSRLLCPPGWKIKVGSGQYGELWLRNYLLIRNNHECTVLASDYANHMAKGEKHALVRSLRHDLNLLMAYARLLKEANAMTAKQTNQKPKGQK